MLESALTEPGGGRLGNESGFTQAGAAMLAKVPLFAGFEPGDIKWLASHAREQKMRKGEVIMRAGDPGLSMMAVLLGEVQVVLASVAGQDQTINILGPGAVFGEMALFDGHPRSADVVARTNGRLMVIERAPVQQMMQNDPRFALRVIEMLCARLRGTLGQLDAILFQDVATRLAVNLLNMAQGSKSPRYVDITQSALGQIVGASREIVNKRLKALSVQGIVAVTPGRILLLDEARLFKLGAGRTI
jgi:CRP-like cAMP-binding protein